MNSRIHLCMIYTYMIPSTVGYQQGSVCSALTGLSPQNPSADASGTEVAIPA